MGDKNYQPKVGDTVKVVIKGTVTWASSISNAFEVGDENSINPDTEQVASVSRVVVDFGPGDTVRSLSDGGLFTIGEDGFFDHKAKNWRAQKDPQFTSEFYEIVKLP